MHPVFRIYDIFLKCFSNSTFNWLLSISQKYFNILPGYKVLCDNMKDYFILDLDPFPSLSLPADPFSEQFFSSTSFGVRQFRP